MISKRDTIKKKPKLGLLDKLKRKNQDRGSFPKDLRPGTAGGAPIIGSAEEDGVDL